MKKLVSTGILLGLCIQQFIIPMNIASAAPVEQRTFGSLLGKEANYKNLFDKILEFDMTSQMLSRKESDNSYSPTIRSSGRYALVNNIEGLRSGILDANNSSQDFDTEIYKKIDKIIRLSRLYSYRESPGTPGITDPQRSNENDEIIIDGKGITNVGLGRIWVSSGAKVTLSSFCSVGSCSRRPMFYQWGNPIDPAITKAAYDEIQRYTMGYRDLPLAPVIPSYNGTPMEYLNDESNRQRDESFFMKDGKEVSDSDVFLLANKILKTEAFVTPDGIFKEEFYRGDHPYYGVICWNEGPCSNLSVKIWETQKKGRYGARGNISFISNRSGYIYYDTRFAPKENTGPGQARDLMFDIRTSTSDLRAALKSVIWDSRGDPCESPDVTTDSVCKAAYGQNTTTSNAPIKVSLRADSGTSSNTYYSDTIAGSSDIKQINVLNGSVTLKWDSNSATSCTLNNQGIPISGTQTFTGLTNNSIVHYLKCTNATTNKSASLYFTASPLNSPDCSTPGSCGQGLPPTTTPPNPYSSSLNSVNRATLTTWISKNITSKKSTLTTAKYNTFLKSIITKIDAIIITTRASTTLTETAKGKRVAIFKYLNFELQQIQDAVEDQDSSFLDDILN